ncbi:MAG: transposase [Chloroflexota bacterium]|nr:transposase [Chloroflexota bacterium]
MPSQSGKGTYRVKLGAPHPTCTCPDHQVRRVKCKRIRAVEISLRREERPDGTTVVTKTTRVTYKQNWPAYNKAQTLETERFAQLLAGLCRGIVQPKQTKGRPRLSLSDVVFGPVFKVYSTVSGRRATSDLKAWQDKGYMLRCPHYNSLLNYLDDSDLTSILKALIEESASPLRAVETDFAVDASGFGTSRFVRWYDHKYGGESRERVWLKAHLMVGVKTNVVTSVEVTPGTAHDSPYLPQLVQSTAARFNVVEVSADKGYLGKDNLAAVAAVGATPYVPFKSNTTGEGPKLWRKLYHYFMFNRDDFLKHYHKRSNVETAFSMIKGKFGDSLRSKTETA